MCGKNNTKYCKVLLDRSELMREMHQQYYYITVIFLKSKFPNLSIIRAQIIAYRPSIIRTTLTSTY